jgi:tRNA threonylcarbamoyl adenosine modification protein YeaZ
MPVVLAIDTSAPRLQLGLLRADGTADTLVEEMAQGHAERIMPAIGELLARDGIGYPDLERIAVTSGPGSFTGLRIGLSAARGLALALKIPVLGIPSLQAISLSGKPHTPLVVLLDARRGEAYFQHFFAPGQPIDGPLLLPTERAWKRVPEGLRPIESPFCDIAALASYAAGLTPSHFPPNPVYVRGADAKPQDKARIARVPT